MTVVRDYTPDAMDGLIKVVQTLHDEEEILYLIDALKHYRFIYRKLSADWELLHETYWGRTRHHVEGLVKAMETIGPLFHDD